MVNRSIFAVGARLAATNGHSAGFHSQDAPTSPGAAATAPGFLLSDGSIGIPKRYRDPLPSQHRPEPDLPLTERIFCGVVLVILVLAAVWISAHLK